MQGIVELQKKIRGEDIKTKWRGDALAADGT